MKTSSDKKKIIFIACALIVILASGIYANSLDGKFIWDDRYLIKDNLYIKDRSHIAKLFTEDIGAGAGLKSSSYRPLQMFTYMIEYSLWKLDVRGYHLMNILLHILAALGIYWLLNILFDDWLISLLTSIFFVVHPIHTEAIAYISGRADPLALVFILLCFIFYIKHLHSEGRGTYLVMVLAYILALLSRENSLILPLLLLLYHYSFKQRFKIKGFLSILSIAFIYILLRLTVLKFPLPLGSCTSTLSQRIPGFFVAIANYIRLLLLPSNLHMEYGNKLFSLTEPQAILGAMILGFLLVFAFRKRDSNRLIFFGIFWFLLCLLPASNLYPINAYMAEHWLYLPSIGLFLIFAQGLIYIYRTKNLKNPGLIFIIALVIFYSYLTIKQNEYWREPITFYKRTLKYAPDSSRVYNDFGIAYSKLGNRKEAIALFKKAIEVEPTCADAHNNLGSLYSSMGKEEEAMALFNRAIELKPNRADMHYNLGLAYRDIDNYKKAIAAYKRAIDINPNHAEAHNNLGSLYSSIGKEEEAIALLDKAIKLNPDYADAYSNLGNIYSSMGKYEQAIAAYKRAIDINPTHAAAHNNLGNVYKTMGKDEEAIALLNKAVELNPNHADMHYNLGLAYRDIGNYKQAIAAYKRAIEINPNHTQAYQDLRALKAIE